MTVVGCTLFVVRCVLRVVRCCLLLVGCRLLAIGRFCWSSVVRCCLLRGVRCLRFDACCSLCVVW